MRAGMILEGTLPEAGRVWRELAEVAVAYVLTEVALWSVGGAQLSWSVATVLWVILATAVSRRSARQLGLTGASVQQFILITGTAAAIGGLMILSAWYGGRAHGLHTAHPLERALLYSVWALFQEFLTQSFVFVRLEAVFGGRWAAFCTAVLFSLAHLPNPVLTPATFVAGLVLALAFRRYRNLYAVGLAHALLGLAVAVSLPDNISHHMRVGAAYGNYLLGVHPVFLVDR